MNKLSNQRLENKVAIITGGSSGLGLATSKLFFDEGATVYICDLNSPDSKEVANYLDNSKYKYINLDVSEEAGWKKLIKYILMENPSIDILVNNAAMSNNDTRWDLVNTSFETWEKAMKVNSSGVFLGMKETIKVMIKQKSGSIINISSIYAKVGSPMGAVYHSAKGSITTLTKAAAIQYAKYNIRVNSVHPGFIETNLTKKLHKEPGVKELRESITPLGRIGEPKDITYGILYLASDESTWVTGSELVIDGGYLAQ